MTAVAPAAPDDESLLLGVVRDLVIELRPVDEAATVTLDSALDRELGLDSLALAELLLRLEDTFGVRLASSVLAVAETPSDLLAAVRRAPRRHPGIPSARPGHAPPLQVERAPDAAATVLDALAWHGHAHPDRLHLRILGDAGPEDELSYADLASSAARVAAGLLARDLLPGDAVAVMLPTGRDYFATFVGILLAGGVPVPVYPPARPSQLEEHLRRQVRILDNARATLLVTVPEAQQLARLVRAHVESMRQVLTPEELAGHGDVAAAARSADDVALLQYTSGSTGNPKGVVLTHANLLANVRAMGRAAHVSSSDVFVSWLPLYHDMGLIGAWLASLYFGMPLVVMPPLVFLSRPSRWLWALHTHRGTLSAAPNFAYELCLRKVDNAEIAGLDLSSWRMAFNGAEPVNPDTVVRFAERFASYGLHRDAIAPVYGLAESCVGLAFPPVGRGPIVERVKREPLLRSGRAELADEADTDPLRFVACGLPLPGHEIRVVDGAGTELGERHEGRIEFRGPSATAGYLRNPQATKALFHGDWLDTGDLGYIAAGDLYVTGRLKDLIIRAGRNLHPEELEAAVGDVPGIRKGCVAVFATADPTTGTERLIVLAESRETDHEALGELRERIANVTVDLLGTPPDDIVLAPPGTVLKTSSGKIRRAASRDLYQRGDLGAHHRPVWWQLARFGSAAMFHRFRRARRVVSGIAFAAWWCLLAAVGGPTLVAVAVLPRRSWRWAVARRAARSLARLTGTRLAVHGAEQLQAGVPVVVVANHPSYLDGLALAATLPGSYVFVTGEGFARKPLIGFLLRRIGCQFVERAEREQGVADTHRLEGIAAQGQTLVLFPEGGLSRMPGLRPFHLGAFVVAASSGRPVVPVAIRGSRSMLRAGHRLVRRGAIHVFVGEPILPLGPDWDAAVELERAARDAILRRCGEPDLA